MYSLNLILDIMFPKYCLKMWVWVWASVAPLTYFFSLGGVGRLSYVCLLWISCVCNTLLQKSARL